MRRPMKRLIENTVFVGLVTACRLATWPTSRSPSLVNATTDGVVRPPSALGMTTGSPPSMTATTELVVPRSMPMIFEATGELLNWVNGQRSTVNGWVQRWPGYRAACSQRAYRRSLSFWQQIGRSGGDPEGRSAAG